eukprot:4982552-Prymnesium_polylepis.1
MTLRGAGGLGKQTKLSSAGSLSEWWSQHTVPVRVVVTHGCVVSCRAAHASVTDTVSMIAGMQVARFLSIVPSYQWRTFEVLQWPPSFPPHRLGAPS